ncbi:MAG: ROK family protein [Salinibacter sp.]|uniref:ROK family protein n=1 Tax=Salinibacter sp. TaxID=2065818 RepID=UPI0035D402C1
MPSTQTLGIDIGGTKVESALVDPSGTVRTSHRHPTNADQGADRVINDIVDCVMECMSRAPEQAAAAGVGVAGQVDSEKGVVRTAPNLGWQNVALQKRLEDALGLPVAIANDVRAITWGVWQHGAGQGIDNLVVVFVGTGIGGGVVSDGHVLNGDRGLAGELGHTSLMPYGRSCRCPNRGCWEAYAGGWAIAERAREAARTDPDMGAALIDQAGRIDNITGRTVHTVSEQGDPLATRIVNTTAEYLGLGLVGVVNAFNPRRVVLGGGVIEGHPSYVDEAHRIVKERGLQVATRGLKVVPSELNAHAGVVGAATVARSRYDLDESSRAERWPLLL